ncbi:hypothetical protein KRP22_011388 [Phytophthora ramorum]|uniref:uncharacterized protein n=1 Tax=Phytophthora ramorum TaxID=164328 RepID=UPI00309F8CE6|nr:hypothetical protein KRP23_3154 [Phytophthora ramorum]KAH7499976.1 hypothetical protein KRP22_10590 [Phytophthora ramorum]
MTKVFPGVNPAQNNGHSCHRRLVSSVKLGWHLLFSPSGLFGAEGRHFLTIFLVREIVEVFTQTYQAYRFSLFLPRVWLNDAAVALLVINCWSTLVVHHFLRKSPALERVLALFVDVFICIAMVIGVPVVLFARYVAAFDLAHQRFNSSVSLYDPTFVAVLILDAKLILATSLMDFIAKLIPHGAIYLSLVSISGLVVRKCHKSPTSQKLTSVSLQSTVRLPKETGKAPHRTKVPKGSSSKGLTHVGSASNAMKMFFCLWGVVVLTLHLHAKFLSQYSGVNGCRASTRPWLMSRMACSTLVVDCHEQGSASVNETIFEQIDGSVLSTLSLIQCSALSMPPALLRFNNLVLLHVYNSTVVSWGNEESGSSNPYLLVLGVVRSLVSSEAAEGLLKPASLYAAQFCDTNLTAVPDTIKLHQNMAIVGFDYNELTTVPASLLSLQSYMISLRANRLETLPDLSNMLRGQTLHSLELNDNPLHELPDTLDPSYFIERLYLQGTNITALPAWTQTHVLKEIYMHGTPYCSSTSPELVQDKVICNDLPTENPNLELPFNWFDSMYAYSEDG